MVDIREDSAAPSRAAVKTDHRKATLHLTAQPTVEFTADQLSPLHGDYARFGLDLPSFAHEVARRLHADGYVGFSPAAEQITIIPVSAIARIDFTQTS